MGYKIYRHLRRKWYGCYQTDMEIVNWVGASLEEIETAVTGMNEPRYRARQIYSGIYHHLYRSWDQFTALGKQLREKLNTQFAITYPKVKKVFISRDGTRRYLLEVGPRQQIESVFIPEERRDTFCISTQIGCAVGCLHCVSGRLPMERNLSPGEIVGQILLMKTDRGTATKRLNIVIMGMGEPLNNYGNVMDSIRLMTDDRGLSIPLRRVTISTSGIVPGIWRLAEEALIPNLAISLNAATDEVRDMLVPVNKRWNIAALLESCRSFPLAHRRWITFEYILIQGVNDSNEDALGLARLLQKVRKKKINLIPLNSHPWIPFKPPSRKRVLEFQRVLSDRHITVHVRRPRGEDISAACGMLATGKKSR
jgi:23S rRNA (adenine2503-C2)-methyltransferase